MKTGEWNWNASWIASKVVEAIGNFESFHLYEMEDSAINYTGKFYVTSSSCKN
jgi:hypothetical protein